MDMGKFVLCAFIFGALFYSPIHAGKDKEKKLPPSAQMVNQAANTREVITNINSLTKDGFGGQTIHIITAMIYAELYKKEFFYTPFTTMEHNYDNDPDFIIKKEKLLNLIGNVKTIDEAQKNKYNIKTDNYLVTFFDKNVGRCAASLSLQMLKKFFRANKNRADFFDDEHLHIAVHIRRHNAHDNRIYGTDIPDDWYLLIIDKLRTKYSEQNPLFHIYSQGDIDNFKVYEAQDTLLHINESVEYTYTSLVLADVLVAGRSSFSYTAGYLSDGIVYYNSYMHAALPHWISIEKLFNE